MPRDIYKGVSSYLGRMFSPRRPIDPNRGEKSFSNPNGLGSLSIFKLEREQI